MGSLQLRNSCISSCLVSSGSDCLCNRPFFQASCLANGLGRQTQGVQNNEANASRWGKGQILAIMKIWVLWIWGLLLCNTTHAPPHTQASAGLFCVTMWKAELREPGLGLMRWRKFESTGDLGIRKEGAEKEKWERLFQFLATLPRISLAKY